MLENFSEIKNLGVNVLQQSHSCSVLVLGFCKPLIQSYLFNSVSTQEMNVKNSNMSSELRIADKDDYRSFYFYSSFCGLYNLCTAVNWRIPASPIQVAFLFCASIFLTKSENRSDPTKARFIFLKMINNRKRQTV